MRVHYNQPLYVSLLSLPGADSQQPPSSLLLLHPNGQIPSAISWVMATELTALLPIDLGLAIEPHPIAHGRYEDNGKVCLCVLSMT